MSGNVYSESGATLVEIHMTNNTEADKTSALKTCQLGVCTDTKRLIYKDNSGNVYRTPSIASGDNCSIPYTLDHYGDSDTLIMFHGDTDRIQVAAGGVTFLDITETTQDVMTINSASADIDFVVNAAAGSPVLFVEGSSGYLGLGTNTPAHAVDIYAATGIPVLQIKSGNSYPEIHITGTITGDGLAGSVQWYNATDTTAAIRAYRVSYDDQYDLTFWTQDHSGAMAERMRIDSAGPIYLGGSCTITSSTACFDIYQGTADASDNAATRIGGGGDVSITRGAWAGFYGNEHATYPAEMRLNVGNAGTGIVRVCQDTGLSVGADNDLTIVISTDAIFTNVTADSDILFKTKNGAAAVGTVLQLDASEDIVRFPMDTGLTVGVGNELSVFVNGDNDATIRNNATGRDINVNLTIGGVETTVASFAGTVGGSVLIAKGLSVGNIAADPGDNNLLVDGNGTIAGAFGCNSKTAKTAYTIPVADCADTDLTKAIAAALIANGICIEEVV